MGWAFGRASIFNILGLLFKTQRRKPLPLGEAHQKKQIGEDDDEEACERRRRCRRYTCSSHRRREKSSWIQLMAQSTSSYGLRKLPNPCGTSFSYASRVTSTTPSSTVLFQGSSSKAAIPRAPALVIVPDPLIDQLLGFVLYWFDCEWCVTGGESIYGGVFADEFHSRLRFNHRGIVAMANESSPNTNGSQFFFTLDKCDWLDKKHTIFGKVKRNWLLSVWQVVFLSSWSCSYR